MSVPHPGGGSDAAVDHLRLAIIGDTQHYRDAAGRLCALEPVAFQVDKWAELFDELVICAPFDPSPPPVGFGPYQADNISIVPLASGGGNRLRDKLAMVRLLPGWALTTRRVARSVDAVHIRCPCNIGLVALLSTWGTTRRRYALYAGVWRGYEGEPFFFGLQRRLLGSRWFKGPVSVYASRQPGHDNLEPFFSPSFSLKAWEAAGAAAEAKIERVGRADRSGPWHLVTVGRLTANKNQRTVIEATARVVAAGVDVTLGVYGDGPCRGDLEALARSLGIADRVVFHGEISHQGVMEAFEAADLHLLATRQEGFGKVLLEGMVYGTVPIFSESPVAAEISGDGRRGLVFSTSDVDGLADHILALVDDGPRWQAMAEAARAYAGESTLDRFADRVRELLERHWKVTLPRPDEDRP
jgi:glycosyltransferase involved in cell wall biosynthesis